MDNTSSFAVAVKVKVIFLGDSTVGKSSIIKMLCSKDFQESLQPTLGIDFCSLLITFNGLLYKLQFWDTAGQERFRSIISSYVRNAQIGIVTTDLSNKLSIESLHSWIESFKAHSPAGSKIIIIGNKTDLPNLEQQRNQLTKKCQELQLPCQFLSAKTKEGKEEFFTMLKTTLSNWTQETNITIDQEPHSRTLKQHFKLNATPLLSKGTLSRCCWI